MNYFNAHVCEGCGAHLRETKGPLHEPIDREVIACCYNCDQPLPAGANICRSCGAEVPAETRATKGRGEGPYLLYRPWTGGTYSFTKEDARWNMTLAILFAGLSVLLLMLQTEVCLGALFILIAGPLLFLSWRRGRKNANGERRGEDFLWGPPMG